MTEQVEEVKPEIRKITQKIIGYRVKTEEMPIQPGTLIEPIVMTLPTPPTKLERGDILNGCTYKVKQPLYWEHGFYLTINNTLVEGRLLPFEIFITSKNSECLPLLEVLSLTLTSMFRLQIDINYLLDEYRTIQDPKGGYRGKKVWLGEKPKYYTSLLGEFADVIERHICSSRDVAVCAEPITVLTEEELLEVDKVFSQITAEKGTDIPGAIECPKCKEIAYVLKDGCRTCLECGESKCG